MVDLYVKLIILGKKTIDDVPASIQEDVQAELSKRGLL